MKIGFNFSLGTTYPLVTQLVRERAIDFCEILIDNFLQVPAVELAAAFDCPVAFHIMFSKYMESDQAALEDLAARLREYIDILRPLYVSDHIAAFSHLGRHLYHLAEVDYAGAYRQIRERTLWWQERLGCRVHLENYPSIMDGGHDAPAFFARLTKETGCGLLFDISNAVCAQRNCGLPLDAWSPLAAEARHFHIAGFTGSILSPRLAIDAHDTDLAPDTLAYLERIGPALALPGRTLTYERDGNIEYEAIVRDLHRLRTALACPKPSHGHAAVNAGASEDRNANVTA